MLEPPVRNDLIELLSANFSAMSIDIAGNSSLVKKYRRLWSWAGDGGIGAFTFKNHGADGASRHSRGS